MDAPEFNVVDSFDGVPPSSEADHALSVSVAAAVRAGVEELDRLDLIVSDAKSRLRSAWQDLSRDGRRSKRDDVFFVWLEDVVTDLKNTLDESRRAVSTFNIAFFGRTGAGKSTLLSALGGLNGELVSPVGRSDYTTDVQALDWRGCRLYDTPGINGWGATKPRAELEESARAAVETADVVLLCFDTQSQQASEFRKVADWVRAYRKPVIAVLNMRNPVWRHPARATPAQRSKLSDIAKQHADNIATELEEIGLPDVPVVAIHSKRALFARAATPFTGPAAPEFESERSAYGVRYLDKWSNLPVLEALISACIVEGASTLRLSGLREGLRTRLREWAGEIERVESDQGARGQALEGVVDEWLNVLGYPDDDWRDRNLPMRASTDILTTLEWSRGEPFTAAVSGRLEGHVRHLLRSHLYPQRMKSLRAAEDLIVDAFDRDSRISDAEFTTRVFDRGGIVGAIATVARQAGDFIADSLKLARVDAEIDLEMIDRDAVTIQGNAGIGGRRASNVLKGTALLGSTASAALGIIALTQFWNPAGWTAAAIFLGLAIFSFVTGLFGKKARKGAESKRAQVRARAIADARTAVNSYFDKCEAEQIARILRDSRGLAAKPLAGLIWDVLHIRDGRAKLTAEVRWLLAQAEDQPPAPSPGEVIQRATERVLAQDAPRPTSVAACLLGEDWVQDADAGTLPAASLSSAESELLRAAADATRSAFATHIDAVMRTDYALVASEWLDRADASDYIDPPGKLELAHARSLLDRRPTVVIIGDYSSGKTSLVKRILAEAGSNGPEGLSVHARPTTTKPERHRLGPYELVDAPGFQSGIEDHDGTAMEVAQEASLLVVVLHVNLLIGDTSRLETLLHGDGAHVGKASHTVFVIGRMDEIGADPVVAPQHFLIRRRRKIEELLSILSSKGLSVSGSQVIAVAADPYGLVADKSPVAREDYAAANRVWDGIDVLSETLHEFGESHTANLAARSALDFGRSALKRACRRTETEIADLDEAQAVALRMTQLVETSLAELRLLRQSIETRTRRTVSDHANEVLAEALGAGPDEIDAMAMRLQSWWEDPRLESAMSTISVEIDRDLDDWSRRYASEFEREVRRLEFARDSAATTADPVAGLATGAHIAANGAKHVGDFVRAIGNRDAVYAIVKGFGGKFKPWGAVKLGAKVAKVGAVLGVVAVGLDVVDWALARRGETRREQARRDAVTYVRDTMDEVLSDLLAQEGGPMSYVESLDDDFVDQLERLRAEYDREREAAVVAARRLDGMIELEGAGDLLADHGMGKGL